MFLFPSPRKQDAVNDFHPVHALGKCEGVEVRDNGLGRFAAQLNEVVRHQVSDQEWAVKALAAMLRRWEA
jgi:hypothetical protein